MSGKCCRFSIVAFGLAVGTTWAIGVFALSMLEMWLGWGEAMIDVIGSVYIGYDTTWMGTLQGCLIAFADGFIGGVIFAFLYNTFLKCCKKESE